MAVSGMKKMLTLITIWTMFVLEVKAQTHYYMDQPSGCGGKQIRVGQAAVFIHGRSKVTPGNPPVTCILYLQTDSPDTKYKLEVTIQSLTINDCAIKLDIFDHQQAFGQHLRSLGCGSKSTDTLYSSGRFVTLKRTISHDLYQPDYDYTLSIRAYDNQDEVGGTSRVNRIGVEVIIPIIIGILLLIFVAIILCCCYRQGRLPGMQGRKPRKSPSMSEFDKKSNGGIDNPVVSVTPGEGRKAMSDRNGFNHQNPVVWSTLASSNSSKDPMTGRQRGRSALMSQSSPVPPPEAPPAPHSGHTNGRQSENYSRSGYSPQNSNRLYRKQSDEQGRNVDSYLESKGVKIGIYPDDSLKRRNMGSEGDRHHNLHYEDEAGRKRGSYAEAQGKGRNSYADDEKKRGSYAEAQDRGRVPYADDVGKKRGSYAEAQVTSQLSFQTYADRLSAPQANDPAFLSPSTSHQRYGGDPTVPEPAHGQEYPGDENVAFYLGLQGQSNAATRVHKPQARNQAIRDKILLPEESLA